MRWTRRRRDDGADVPRHRGARASGGAPKKLASALALELREQFRANGFSIHARGACVRVHGPDADHVGREMTPEEMAALGVDRVG